MNKNLIITIVTLIVIVIIGAVLAILIMKNKEMDVASNENSSSTENSESNKTEEKTEKENDKKENEEGSIEEMFKNIDYLKIMEEQLAPAKKGETIAIMKIKNMGDIKIKFFKDEAPKAVENFVTHSKKGYYDGTIFHRVIKDFMIQGGDPEGTGMGGESIWGEPFEVERSPKRFPFRGTLAMAKTAAPISIGSQFFIVEGDYDERTAEGLKAEALFEGTKVVEAYKKYKGAPHLFSDYTVFGQVIEGMDIVDKIQEMETNSADKPLTDVVIEKIEIKEGK